MINQLSGLFFWPRTSIRPRKILLRVGIITAQLILMGLIVYNFSSDTMLMVPAAIIGFGAVVLLLRWPAIGLVLLTFVGMIIPNIAESELNATILLMAAILGIWIVDMIVVRQSIYIANSSAIWPLLILGVICLISLLLGQMPWFGEVEGAPLNAQLGAFAIFIFSIGVTIFAGTQIRDLRWLQVITWVFIGVGSLFVITRLLPQQWGLTALIFQGQAFGGIFYAWLPAMVFGQALFNNKLQPWLRAFLFFISLGVLYIVFVQNFGWKSGWVTVSISLGVLLILRDFRWGIIVGAIGLLAYYTILPDVVASEDYSIITRFEAWIILGEMLKNSPFLGLGFANYYWYTPLYSIRGWNVQFNSHNNYIDIIAQVGLIGLLCLIWFFAAIGRIGWQLRTRVPEGFARAYVNSCLAGLITTLVVATLGDWLLPFVYNIGMNGMRTGVLAWLFLGGLIALEQMYSPGRSVTEQHN